MELYADNRSQWYENCTVGISEYDWASLNLIRSVAASFGAVIIICILLLLVYSKSYSTLFQRLYLYLIVATLLNETVGVISIEHQWMYHRQELVCKIVGMLTGWTYVVLFFFSYEIIFYLLYRVVWMIMGTPQCGIGHNAVTKCCGRVIIEAALCFFPVFIATVFAVPPYLQDRYGLAGPWCFVRSLDDDCNPTGKQIQMAFYGMYMAVGAAGFIASIIFTVVYFKLATNFKEARQLLKRTLYVLIFKFVHIIMILCSVACRLYTLESRQRRYYVLWLSHALAVPLGVLVFPLGYLVCFYPIRKMAKRFYRSLIVKCFKRNTSISRVPDVREAATAPRSERISQPSETFFYVSHPDELTERTPLLSDAGMSARN